MKEENNDMINAYVEEEFNDEQEIYMGVSSSFDKKRKCERDDNQDYSPPKSFIAKRW